jgi:hypothetical protein
MPRARLILPLTAFEIAMSYRAGATLAELAVQCGCSHTLIAHTLACQGVERRHSGRRHGARDPARVADILAAVAISGQAAAARKFGISRQAVCRIVARYGTRR